MVCLHDKNNWMLLLTIVNANDDERNRSSSKVEKRMTVAEKVLLPRSVKAALLLKVLSLS